MPERAQQAHCQNACLGETRVWHDRANGWQAHSHHWLSAGQLCHDDDGRLLQLEALGVLAESGDKCLLKSEARPGRPNQGYGEAKREKKGTGDENNGKTPNKTALNQQRMGTFTENSGFLRCSTT